MHGYFSYAFLISLAKTLIILSPLMDESNIVGFTDCYQPQVKAIYQLNQDYLLRMKNLLKKKTNLQRKKIIKKHISPIID